MFHPVLNYLTLGIKPLYERQRSFHDIIMEFRHKFSNPGRAHLLRADIDDFYGKLNAFDYRFVLFKDYFRKYIDTLQRFRPSQIENETDLAFLRIALAENKWKPTAPFRVLLHHLKYRYTLTAGPYVSNQKKQQRKKLNSPDISAAQREKWDPSKKWVRVPLNRSGGNS